MVREQTTRGDNLNEAIVVLSAATELVERAHTKGADARDDQGRPVLPTENDAVAWSAAGALFKAGRAVRFPVFLDALAALAAAVGVDAGDVRRWPEEQAPTLTRQLCERVWEWEDRPHRTTGHVLSALARAKEMIV